MQQVIFCFSFPSGPMDCNLFERTEAQQCFGALGEPFIFYPLTGANTQELLTKDGITILKVANHSGTVYSKYRDHSSFFTNGTFKLKKLCKNDSGYYGLDTHNLADGVLQHRKNISLEIQGKTKNVYLMPYQNYFHRLTTICT